MRFVSYFTLLASAVYAGVLRKRQSCPDVCDAAQCAAAPRACYYGEAKDACGCCVVCAAGEGEACGGRSGGGGGLSCGEGLLCESGPGSCVCASPGPVCGSDGRTYPSTCRLRAENRRAELGEGPAVILIQRGWCDPALHHQGSMRYKFNFIADVVDKIVPAVVHLELFQRVPFSGDEVSGDEVSVSSGSGFVVSEDGWILTSAHVLNNKQRIKVELKSGARYDATVKDVDRKIDVALIKIQPDGPLPVLRLGQSPDLRPGEFVVAVGSPFSLQNTVTTGIISAAQRSGVELGFNDSDMDYIQTDAIINDGDVIGINTLKVAAGIAFAIPVDRIRQFLADSHNRQVNGNTEQKKKHIGVRMLQLSPSLIRDLKEREVNFPDVSSGVYIHEVIPGTAASSAGVMDHDVIVGINGRPVHTVQEVSDAVQSSVALSVTVRRKDQDVTLTIIPEETEDLLW